MLLEIIRVEQNPFETVGFLLFNKKRLGFVLEPPWLENRKCVSCIPSGEYLCKRVRSPRFGKTWEIPAPGRSHVIFHWGNTIFDSEGCPLPGMEIGYLNGMRSVIHSKTCFRYLMTETEFLDELKLTVTNAWGTGQ
jgi:hypothetical protein